MSTAYCLGAFLKDLSQMARISWLCEKFAGNSAGFLLRQRMTARGILIPTLEGQRQSFF